MMTDTSADDTKQMCTCGSGMEYSRCCGVEGRNALNADIYAYVTTRGITSEDKLTPELKSAIETVAEDPQLFPARVNLFTDKAWFIKMSPTTYRESVFLDPARMKGTCLIESNLEWLKAVCDKIQWQSTAFIFHSAFCGSTLMSQILETVFTCLSLREPELLTSMLVYNRSEATQEEKTLWFDNLQKLLSRRFESNQSIVVKGNDFANPLMPDVVSWKPDVPFLFMYTPLDEFTVACVKADNRRDWVKQRYGSVKSFLRETFNLDGDIEIDESDYGQLAAVYWSYNVAMYLQVANRESENIKSLDFNDMLANPDEAIKQCGKLFELKRNEEVDFDSSVSTLMGVYSKNSEFKYSPEQRREDLKKQLAQFKKELESGEKLARKLLGESYPAKGLPNGLLDT